MKPTNLFPVLAAVIVVAAVFYWVRQPSTPSVPGNSADPTVTTSTGPGPSAGEPAGGGNPPTNSGSPKAAAVPASKNLVSVTYIGGVCPNGQECSTVRLVTRSGMYYKNGQAQVQLNRSDVDRLSQLVAATDFSFIRSKTFTGQCPRATGGQEIIYTFYGANRTETISNCQTQVDFNLPLFDLTRRLIPQN